MTLIYEGPEALQALCIHVPPCGVRSIAGMEGVKYLRAHCAIGNISMFGYRPAESLRTQIPADMVASLSVRVQGEKWFAYPLQQGADFEDYFFHNVSFGAAQVDEHSAAFTGELAAIAIRAWAFVGHDKVDWLDFFNRRQLENIGHEHKSGMLEKWQQADVLESSETISKDIDEFLLWAGQMTDALATIPYGDENDFVFQDVELLPDGKTQLWHSLKIHEPPTEKESDPANEPSDIHPLKGQTEKFLELLFAQWPEQYRTLLEEPELCNLVKTYTGMTRKPFRAKIQAMKRAYKVPDSWCKRGPTRLETIPESELTSLAEGIVLQLSEKK